MAADWRRTLTFSDRLSTTSKMHLNEEAARKAALTLSEYHELCAKSTHLLPSPAPAEPVQDYHVDGHVFPNLPHTGARIGRYIDAEHHKDGLFSEVFKAIDPTTISPTERPSLVALKFTTPDLMVPPHDSARESRILNAVKGRNIIPLIETFQQAGGHLVLAFPFMPYDVGTMLRTQQLTDTSRIAILRDLFAGLQHLHQLEIIHRDIKPSNILLASPSGPAYIADFGIAWSTQDSSSEYSHEKILDVGTTSYRPPELLFGNQAYGNKLDIWAAGCTAAQIVCLGSKPLFDAGDLGSELALIRSMFETLGTPDLESWPYPGKPWESILTGAPPNAVELVQNLVVYESTERYSAEQALAHQFFKDPRD
nr:cyclin-dependent kinase 7 [Quercus suber]